VTPLQLAVERERIKVVKCLIEVGNMDVTKLDQVITIIFHSLLACKCFLFKPHVVYTQYSVVVHVDLGFLAIS